MIARRKRKSLGLTQKQLADKAGLSQSYVSRVEAGLKTPEGVNKAKLEYALDEVNVD